MKFHSAFFAADDKKPYICNDKVGFNGAAGSKKTFINLIHKPIKSQSV